MPDLVLGAFAFTEAVTVSSLSKNQCPFLFPTEPWGCPGTSLALSHRAFQDWCLWWDMEGSGEGQWFMSYLNQALWSHFPCQGLFKNGYKRIHQSRCEGKSTRWFLCSQEKIPKRKSSFHWVTWSQTWHLKLPQSPHNGKDSSCKDKLTCRRWLRT